MTAHTDPDSFSRISKIFVDRDQELPTASLERRKHQVVELICGADVARSYTLQLAVLTAAMIANRCFPGGVKVVMEDAVNSAALVFGRRSATLGKRLKRALGYDPTASAPAVGSHALIFGDTNVRTGLRVTFDGWVAKVGPANQIDRLLEREYCTLAGVAAAALAVSEVFLEFAEINIEAKSRVVALSLWRPDLAASDAAALGVPVEFLPSGAWILGLGHLGQAYLWSLATLPYVNPREVDLTLLDFDKVVPANEETGLLVSFRDHERYKTRVCARWLERAGFNTRLIERRFGVDFRCDANEPQIALCGFDNNEGRRALGGAGFDRVVECGLGGTAENFDVLNLHTLPNKRTAAEIWPSDSDDRTTVAAENPAYQELADECGRVLLAGKAVAVPFVGATAGALVMAEVLRLLHAGPSYEQLKLRLGTSAMATAVGFGSYQSVDLGAIGYRPAKALASA